MNARDPLFTARLEEALTILANQPTRSLAYLENRFDLETGDLQVWLNEFNGAQKALKFERIHAVKRELGGLTTTTAKEPNGHAPAAAAPAAPSPARATETTSKPAPRALPPAVVGTATIEGVDDGTSPWAEPSRQFRAKTFQKWRPIIAKLTEAERPRTNAICAAAGVSRTGLHQYVGYWIGTAIQETSPESIRRFLAWGDARCGAPAGEPRSAAQPPAAKAAGAPAVAEPPKSDALGQWRADAIAALVKMGVQPRAAKVKVDAAIAKLNGAEVDTGELVKLALKESFITLPPATPPAYTAAKIIDLAKEFGIKLPSKSTSESAIMIAGTAFRIELTVRLVPVTEGA